VTSKTDQRIRGTAPVPPQPTQSTRRSMGICDTFKGAHYETPDCTNWKPRAAAPAVKDAPREPLSKEALGRLMDDIGLQTALEQIAKLPLGDHRAKQIAQAALAGEDATPRTPLRDRLEEAEWWQYLHTCLPHCGMVGCDKCERIADLRKRAALRAATPQTRMDYDTEWGGDNDAPQGED
jgi:hypothetical protein